jgi:hypothetical protein
MMNLLNARRALRVAEFRRGVFSILGHRPQLRGEFEEISLLLTGQRLAQDFAVFGFRRAAMPRRTVFQAHDQLWIDIANMQTFGHGGHTPDN